MEDACDTGLVLGRGRCNPSLKSKAPSTNPKVDDLQPSLTLALSDDTYMSNSKEAKETANSSFSSAHLSNVKRENDHVVGSEETERVSSRTSDEEEEGGVRKKLRLTKEQSAFLEDKFKNNTTLSPKQKQALAKQLNLRPRQVEVWFQNRRARTKLKQTEVDCEVLKRCCETLSDENRRLQKELEELKALKLTTSPIYMQMTAAGGGHHCSYSLPFVREGQRNKRRSEGWSLRRGAQSSVLESICSICSLLIEKAIYYSLQLQEHPLFFKGLGVIIIIVMNSFRLVGFSNYLNFRLKFL